MKRSGALAITIDDVGQVDEILLLDLDQAQALRRVLVEQRLDQRRLAGAARAGQQHVVRGQSRDELARVALDRAASASSMRDEVVERDAMRMRDRLQVAAAAALAPAEGDDASSSPDRGMRRRQQRLDAARAALRRARCSADVGTRSLAVDGHAQARSAAVIRVDAHVVVREVAGPHGGGGRAAAELARAR